MALGWWKNRQNEAEKNKKERPTRSRVADRRAFRLEKIKALTEKFYAVAAKRKWLVFMMGLGIIIYLLVSTGGLGKIGGIFETIKGFF